MKTVLLLVGVLFFGAASLMAVTLGRIKFSAATPEPGRIGFALITLGAFTAPWNAVSLAGSFNVSDLLMLAGTVLALPLVLVRGLAILPRWLFATFFFLVLSAAYVAIDPPSNSYLVSRYVPVETLALGQASGGNTVQAIKFIFAWCVVPIIVAAVCTNRARLQLVGDALAAGTVVSCIAAFTDSINLTSFSDTLNGFVDISGRQAGLTTQENHLALTAVIAAPFLFSWVARPGSGWKIAGIAGVVIDLWGLNLSGSRGPTLTLVPVLLILLLANKRARRLLPIFGPIALAFLLILSSYVYTILSRGTLGQRVLGRSGITESDSIRSQLLSQAMKDFVSHPLAGIGFTQVVSAHELFVELLAAGGVIAFAGGLIFWGNLLRLGHLNQGLTTARLAYASIGVWLVNGLVENQIYDRYLMVPAGMLIAADALRHRQHDPSAGGRDSVVPQLLSAVRDRRGIATHAAN